ncbi:MAG: HWE histidine kinase domain-containing protein [Pseudomonadota bacterium]
MNHHFTSRELTECDREPIHNIAQIQPHGGFIKLNADWVIAHISTNCAAMLGLDENPVGGTALAKVLAPRAITVLKEALHRIVEPDQIERIFGVKLTEAACLFDCALHTVGDRMVIEFERHSQEQHADHVAMIGPILARLEPIRDFGTLCATAANLMREKLSYDRVMVYKFHADETGEVIAEAKREDLEPFLGLRYPQTDIPAQARELFRRNKFRTIADIDDELVPIQPPQALGGRALDMSMSGLRASSQIHLQYLRNMGVRATMTIAIVRQGRLWGLISCHHYTPHLPAYSLRTVAEMFSQMFSLMLDRLLIDRSEQVRTKGRSIHDKLMQRLAGGTVLSENLPMLHDLLKDAIAHDGASILIDGEYSTRGIAPSHSEFMALAPALGTAPVSTIIATPSLASEAQAAAAFADRVTGALILPISRSPRDYLILWRKPLAQTIRWAGNPAKAVLPGTERLQPRESFAAWSEEIRDRSEDWTDDDLLIADGLRVTLLEVILRMTDEVAKERARAQEQQELLIAELNHRVRNILNLIRGLVSQSQHDAIDVSAFASNIGGRIAALASAHNNITRENWSPAPLTSLFETEMAAYLNEKADRFKISGDEVLVAPEAYTVLALVVHELVTNSAKYGSLCDRSGSLSVDVKRTHFGDIKIAWREYGGPPVKPPTRRGFGSTIIERSIPFELKGEAELRFKLTGLEADFLVPSQYITPVTARESRESSAGNDNACAESETLALADLPKHMLLVEDSMIIALDTEENLRRLGVNSVDLSSNVSGALAAIEQRQPDLAILDFNLGDGSSMPVAKELVRRGVPFVLATGYAELGEKASEIGARYLLRKPYGKAEIQTLLSSYASEQWAESLETQAPGGDETDATSLTADG